MNLEKLQTMVDAHHQLIASYRLLTASTREATIAAGQLSAEICSHDLTGAAEELLARPMDELASTPPDELVKLEIRPEIMRAYLTSQRRAERSRQEAEALAARVRDSRALLDRLVEHARSHGEHVIF